MSPTSRGVSTPQTAPDRLSRLLAMVPYLLARHGISLTEAAAHFEISEAQMVADLQLLFVCGLPGHLPDDLIEAEWESGRVYLSNADTIARPLRLGMDEAISLLAGLRTLADSPGAVDVAALRGAQAKLTEATGDAAASAGSVAVSLDDEADPELLGRVRAAVTDHRRVRLRYLVPARDEITERDVDPMRVISEAGHWYLEGWCHRAEAVRLFRLSRVLEADVLAEDGTPPASAVGRDLATLFTASPEDLVVTLRLGAQQTWVIDTYGAELVAEGEEPLVRIRAAEIGWIRQLVLRSGGEIAVLEPPELVAEVAAASAAALSRYR